MTCDFIGADTRELRNALGRFATGVCIVTTRAKSGSTAGLTVNSFSSVSLDPPLISWCLERRAPSLPTFLSAEHFVVHVLAVDQQDICLHFSKPSKDKFSIFHDKFEYGVNDIPMLKNSLARFECKKEFMYDAGDHLIFIGQVERFTYSEQAPLLFHSGRFLHRTDVAQ